MSRAKNNRIKARRKKKAEDLKYKKMGDEFRQSQKDKLNAEMLLDEAIKTPKRFPTRIFNKPKKKNKGLVDKFKALFKRRVK